MANNYLLFAEILEDVMLEETTWLRHQLEPIVVIDGAEYPEGDDSLSDLKTEPSYEGMRFLRNYDGLDNTDDREYRYDDAHYQGFEVEFEDDGDVLFFAEEHGDPARLAHLVQQFLRRFRPNECWPLSYAKTCSKPHPSEFGGGAAFVTADEIRWQSSFTFVEQQLTAFKAGRSAHAGPSAIEGHPNSDVEAGGGNLE
jgi:hypothetical protein